MFTSTALFKKVACPELSKCSLLNCIFSHQSLPSAKIKSGTPASSAQVRQDTNVAPVAMDSQEDSPQTNRPRKKRRIDNDETNEAKNIVGSQSKSSTLKPWGSPSHKFLTRGIAQASRSETPQLSDDLSTDRKIAPIRKDISRVPDGQPRTLKGTNPETILKRKYMDQPQESDLAPMRKVNKNPSEGTTPPHNTSRSQPSQESIKESLNPRLIPKPPASHTIRIKLLSLLHQHITKLNEQTKLLNHPSNSSIIMSPQQVTTEAMDIEVRVAEENPFVYQNVMKQRIMKYKNMTQEEWEMERFTRNPRPNAIPIVNPNPAPRIDTGLSSKDELAFLPRIHANQALLSSFSYVTSAPSQQEMDAAVQGVEAAHHWEVCERCTTRFQVFPGRRPEDGVSTTGGRCRFHWGKRCRLAGGEYGFSCCKQPQGTKGCQPMSTHVFKVSDPKRLAAIMPFLETPENPARLSGEAVAFDCEMGYTTFGLELIRLTAISWPTGAKLVDVLVRPLGEVLDFNSRFSGVWPAVYAKALEATLLGSAGHEEAKSPKMVGSPAEARALFFKYISPTTPLIGHALENDLKAIRVIHPCIVDTVDLFPHSQGLPKRNSLRGLSKMLLDRDIQCESEMRGHDSHEDAAAAGDLVRVKIREVVKKWEARGYKVGDGEFPPMGGDINTPPRKSH